MGPRHGLKPQQVSALISGYLPKTNLQLGAACPFWMIWLSESPRRLLGSAAGSWHLGMRGGNIE